jgi:hypothetical protein
VGMFDWYEPVPSLSCPVCGTPLCEWQGKDGPNLLFVWRQGCPAPVDWRVAPDLQAGEPDKWRLPDTFCFRSWDCACPYPVEAVGRTEWEVWTGTTLITAANAADYRPSYKKELTRAEYDRWLRWLQSKPDAPG